MRNADGIERGLYDGAAMAPEGRVEHALAWIAGDYPPKWLRLVGLCERAAESGWPPSRALSCRYAASSAWTTTCGACSAATC